MEFIKRSLTGKYDYYSDSQSDIRLVLVRCDYNPNQPRDEKGRWASGGGGGSGGGSRSRGGKKGGGSAGGLASKKVSELQAIAKDHGIDIDTLSHKARKSVLSAAIEATQKGKDLREAGLLKAVKPKRERSPKPPKIEPTKLPVAKRRIVDLDSFVEVSKPSTVDLKGRTDISERELRALGIQYDGKTKPALEDYHVDWLNNIRNGHNSYEEMLNAKPVRGSKTLTLYQGDRVEMDMNLGFASSIPTVNVRVDGDYNQDLFGERKIPFQQIRDATKVFKEFINSPQGDRILQAIPAQADAAFEGRVRLYKSLGFKNLEEIKKEGKLAKKEIQKLEETQRKTFIFDDNPNSQLFYIPPSKLKQ